MPLGILELLTRVGEENVQVQNVADNMVRANVRPNQMTIEFVTAPDRMSGDYVGMVVWMPANLVREAKLAHDRQPKD